MQMINEISLKIHQTVPKTVPERRLGKIIWILCTVSASIRKKTRKKYHLLILNCTKERERPQIQGKTENSVNQRDKRYCSQRTLSIPSIKFPIDLKRKNQRLHRPKTFKNIETDNQSKKEATDQSTIHSYWKRRLPLYNLRRNTNDHSPQ